MKKNRFSNLFIAFVNFLIKQEVMYKQFFKSVT